MPVLWITTLACALTILMWVQQTLGLQVSTHAFGMMTLGLAAIAALQLSYIGPKVRALQLGRDGERAVGQFLEQQLLSEGARVIHDIPADGFNLDHVVISPARGLRHRDQDPHEASLPGRPDQFRWRGPGDRRVQTRPQSHRAGAGLQPLAV